MANIPITIISSQSLIIKIKTSPVPAGTPPSLKFDFIILFNDVLPIRNGMRFYQLIQKVETMERETQTATRFSSSGRPLKKEEPAVTLLRFHLTLCLSSHIFSFGIFLQPANPAKEYAFIPPSANIFICLKSHPRIKN